MWMLNRGYSIDEFILRNRKRLVRFCSIVNLMQNDDLKKFEELVAKREGLVKSLEENEGSLERLLVGIYNDSSHFIYEILQNAEDEKAKKVRFELREDGLDIYHDGDLFDFTDIKGVTGIGTETTKKGDSGAIGKFGIGFKSVFAVTKTPHIFSGKFNIKIRDFCIPSKVDSPMNNDDWRGGKTTLIRLPFDREPGKEEKVFDKIQKKLEGLELKTLLFLNYIEKIEWKTPSGVGCYSRSSRDVQNKSELKRITLKTTKETEEYEEYIVFGKPTSVDGKKSRVEVAYRLGIGENDKEIIIRDPDSRLVVFFPTEQVTSLNFIIQGPYKTSTDRANIMQDDESNDMLIKETGNLVAESLSTIRELGYLDVNFLKLLPIDLAHKENNPIYSVIYEKVKEKFLSGEDLLPTFDGNYTKADIAILAGVKDLTEILSDTDVQKLFGRRKWLDTNITTSRARDLLNYLTGELGITEVDFEGFVRKITSDFFQDKDDGWMIRFYGRLLDQPALLEILKVKPIIRLENGEHRTPFNDRDVAQVWLPTENGSKYPTVKSFLAKDGNSLKFFTKLGLTTPDIFAEINEFILPKYTDVNSVIDEEYFEDFKKILTAYGKVETNKKDKFIQRISGANFVDSTKNTTTEHVLMQPPKVYLRSDDLKDYFNGVASVYFVSDKLYEKFDEERLVQFLRELGAEDAPRRIEGVANLSSEEKLKLINTSGFTNEIYAKDYEYEGLESLLGQISVAKSCLLWKLLLKNIENMNSSDAQLFFRGEYSWFYYGKHRADFTAKFAKALKDKDWLVDQSGNFKKSSDIMAEELSENYLSESPNKDVLIDTLEFRPSIWSQLPKEDQEMLQVVKDGNITIEDLKKLSARKAENEKKELIENPEDRWVPEVKPEKAMIRVVDYEAPEFLPIERTGQEELVKESPTREAGPPLELRFTNRKEIGKWGEDYAHFYLKEKYNGSRFEVVYLGDSGRGYDFVIKDSGKETEYVEVKTKIKGDEEVIEVTGPQWEWARALYKRGEGEKYAFYVVINAGKENVEIRILRNPAKLWFEGKLFAHPIKFKLPNQD